MVSDADIAADYAARFARQLGATEAQAGQALMSARPADLVAALERLVVEGQRDRLGAFAVGATFGTEYLPDDPVVAMAEGKAHPVPLIVGTNADEGRLFTRFLKLLPTTETAIERMLADVEAGGRERLLAAYPGYPRTNACVQFGGDFIFGSAVWQIAQAHAAVAPTYVYRYDYATKALKWSGMGATHATELLAVFDVYRSKFGRLLAAGVDSRSARKVSDDIQGRWLAFADRAVPGSDWPQYTRVERAVLLQDRRRRVTFDPNSERRLAWEGFFLAAR
jgi:para-nitrobenzyl esterase